MKGTISTFETLPFSSAPALDARRVGGLSPPLWGAPVLPGGPSPGAVVAFPRRGVWLIATNQIAHFRPRRI